MGFQPCPLPIWTPRRILLEQVGQGRQQTGSFFWLVAARPPVDAPGPAGPLPPVVPAVRGQRSARPILKSQPVFDPRHAPASNSPSPRRAAVAAHRADCRITRWPRVAGWAPGPPFPTRLGEPYVVAAAGFALWRCRDTSRGSPGVRLASPAPTATARL